MRTACVCIRFSATQRPAARIVVPVSTRSTTASARPRPTAASTEPEMSVILVSTPSCLSMGAKKERVRCGKDVAMRQPAKSVAEHAFLRSGTCSERKHLPIPSSSSVVTVQPASATMSCPVIPASTLPIPMNDAMSFAGKKTSVMGKLVQCATSSRSRRWYCKPAASTNLRHISARRPFLGSASSMLPLVLAPPSVEMLAPSSADCGTPAECAVSAPSADSKPSRSICESSVSRRWAAATAWPCSPSIFASACASRTRSAAVFRFESDIHVRTRRKVNTERPPVERAVPPVGSVWLGPAP
mmetsp:Transcript_15740/g.48947  ORF Transcript_15740/g.48947 Transcript_15740/m.48947 type:complete len:300 (-) Transcript_15740:1103-2002(-)